MAACYFDSSALVKRYAQETGSSWVTSATGDNNEVFISMAGRVAIQVFKL
jgi:predicted nucleic acid-binding protein